MMNGTKKPKALPANVCVWDAFGDFSCGKKSPGKPQTNPFARKNTARPDWEMFAEKGRRDEEGFAEPTAYQGREGFCGCQAPVG